MRACNRLGKLAAGLGVFVLVTAGCSLGGGDQQAQPPVKPRQVRSDTPTPAAPQSSAASAPTSSTPAPAEPSASASTDPAVAPSSPAVPPSSGEPPRLVRYPGDGVTVQSGADATKLAGTSRAFRQFVVASVPQGSADCTTGGSISVQAWRADGFAVGDVFECPGGYRAIWGTNGGASWRELVGSQDVWSCAQLRRHHVPTSIAGDRCYGAGELRDYRQP